jgi:prolipoprotein diacylglyceryltransferase
LTIFSLLLALAVVLGLAWITLDSPTRLRSASLNAAAMVLLAALIGGRAAYVTPNWEYFQNHLIDIPQVWLGGLAWPGALAGAILGVFIAARGSEIPVAALADRLLPLFASLSVAVWLGCWVTGCAYGPESGWGLPAKDEWGFWKNRVPLQLIGATLTVASFWSVERFRQRKKNLSPGLAASVGLGLLCLILLGASILRADPYPIYFGLRLETWAAIALLIISILSVGYAIIKGHR